MSIKSIWNSESMNALRLQHLKGERCKNPVCGQCGQLSHCLPDNIDQYTSTLLPKFIEHVGGAVSESTIPGMQSVKSIPIILNK